MSAGWGVLRAGSLPEDLSRRPFTVAEALARGVTRRTLDNPILLRPFVGVRVHAGVPDGLAVHAAAAVLALPASAALSHATAAALLGLPLPAGVSGRGPVRASVPALAVVPRIEGIDVREGLDPRQVTVVRGLRVVAAARTWVDLAPELGDVDALVLADAVLTRCGGPHQVDDVLATRTGHRGVVRLRELGMRARYPVRSAMETRWRLMVAAAGIPAPLLNQPVRDHAGEWIACPDTQWPEVRVAAEYDGLHHCADARQWRHDIARKELMEDEGWRVLRITSDDVLLHPHRAVDRLWRVLHDRGLPGLPPRA